jgi:hypothetical protein
VDGNNICQLLSDPLVEISIVVYGDHHLVRVLVGN